MTTDNPQARGFNYGQPIGLPNPPDWPLWCDIADTLRLAQVGNSTRSWALDAALRDLRIATTPEQHAAAVDVCRRLFAAYAGNELDRLRAAQAQTLARVALGILPDSSDVHTDRAIIVRDVQNLIDAARLVVAYGSTSGTHRESLRAALGYFKHWQGE